MSSPSGREVAASSFRVTPGGWGRFQGEMDILFLLLILLLLAPGEDPKPGTNPSNLMIKALEEFAGAVPDLNVGSTISAKDLHQNCKAPRPRDQIAPQKDGFWLFAREGDPNWIIAVQMTGPNGNLAWRVRYRNISRRQLLTTFREELARAQEQRRSRLDWIEFERNTMLGLVNEERRLRGLPQVSLEDILWVETMAEGHMDYSKKFAIYCAEMATGVDPRKIEP